MAQLDVEPRAKDKHKNQDKDNHKAHEPNSTIAQNGYSLISGLGLVGHWVRKRMNGV